MWQLLSVTYSISRLYEKDKIEGGVEEQSGFRAGRSTTDNLFVLKQFVEESVVSDLETHLVFVILRCGKDYNKVVNQPQICRVAR